jgi:two-component system chemotaxis response regulator CheY
MYTIGELSKIVKISIDALRHYDEIGLLKPHHIDTSNRYRYYTSEQVSEIITIMEWKQYGFSLDVIRDLLPCTDTERIRSTFLERLKQLIVERSSIDRSIDLLQERIRNLKGEMRMNKKTVLIIDDSAFLCGILADILEKHGLAVIGTADNGEAGLSMFAQLKPDVVILDIGLPDIDGIQVARKIIELDCNAKIVMCTARDQLQTILQSLRAGASHFIAKPFLPEALLESLNITLEGAVNYSHETITSIQADTRVGEIREHLSQEWINDLLTLCKKEYHMDSPEYIEFWGNIAAH